jgi:hypothetical protein
MRRDSAFSRVGSLGQSASFDAKSPKHTDTEFAIAAEKRGFRQLHILSTPEAGHGNDRVWKAWKAIKPAFHPSPTLWKSLQDSHITTASTAS